MLWLELLTMPDGSRVESGLFAVQTAGAGPAARAYRLRLVDGSVTEFSSLPDILRYLVDHYDADELSLATGHEALTTHHDPRHVPDHGAGRRRAGADPRRRLSSGGGGLR